MAVNKPRKPSIPLTKTTAKRSAVKGANEGQRLANRLAKQYEKALQQRAREQGRAAQRVGRTSTPQDTYADVTTPTADDRLDPFSQGEPVQLGLWDSAEDDTGGPVWEQVAFEFDGEGVSPSATEYVSPTNSIEPGRPRTREMAYNRQTHTLRVVFRHGGTYEYFGVPPALWYRIKRVRSPGRFLDKHIIGYYRFEKVAF